MRLSQKFFLRGRLQHIPSYRWLSYTTYSKNNVALLTIHYSLFTYLGFAGKPRLMASMGSCITLRKSSFWRGSLVRFTGV